VLSLHHIRGLGGAHAQAESTGRAQILAMTRRWSARVWPRGSAAERVGLTQVPVMGRRAERVPVPAYRRMDALPACRMSRGHSTLLKRCSPLGAAEAPPRLRSPTGTRQTRQCLRYCFQTGVRRYEYHANPALGATSPRDVVLVGTIRPRRLRPANFHCSGLRRSGTKAARAKPAVSPRPESQGALILALIG